MINNKLCLLYMSLSVVSCGSDKKSAHIDQNLKLDGIWSGPCASYGANASGNFGEKYRKLTIRISGNLISLDTEGYTLESCDTSSLVETTKLIGSNTISENKIDSSITKVVIQPNANTDIGMNTLKGLCPSLTFAVGKETDVTTCDAFKTALITLYDIYQLSSEDILYLGKTTGELNGSSAQLRPQEIDLEKKYQKQQ